MWNTIKEWMTFNRKERIGVLFLLLIAGVLLVLPYLFRPAAGTQDPESYKKMEEEISHFENRKNDSVFSSRPVVSKKDADQISIGVRLFDFNPNAMDIEHWKELGITDRVANTIVHYINKGGKFKKAEDLKRIYGFRESDYERLLPYIRFSEQSRYTKYSSEKKTRFDHEDNFKKVILSVYPTTSETRSAYRSKTLKLTDINLADSTAWCDLPGIGERLASRIIRFREKLGGFYDVSQVAETYALPDSTFQKIKPYLTISSTPPNKIDLNKATQSDLQNHPYIRWKLSKLILSYRNQHGRFGSVEEIMQIPGIDSLIFKKLHPYLRAEQ